MKGATSRFGIAAILPLSRRQMYVDKVSPECCVWTSRRDRLQNVSTKLERHRRLLAVEAAKKRERARDVGLMERALRQAAARKKSGMAAKARFVVNPALLLVRFAFTVHSSFVPVAILK